jgi:hypothetical protein
VLLGVEGTVNDEGQVVPIPMFPAPDRGFTHNPVAVPVVVNVSIL